MSKRVDDLIKALDKFEPDDFCENLCVMMLDSGCDECPFLDDNSFDEFKERIEMIDGK